MKDTWVELGVTLDWIRIGVGLAMVRSLGFRVDSYRLQMDWWR